MDLVIDTTNVKFQVSGSFEPRLDKDGVHRKDKQGRTGLPLWAVQLVAWTDKGAETVLVSVALSEPPAVSQGQFVSVERLQAMPWVQNGNARVAYRANAVIPHASPNAKQASS